MSRIPKLRFKEFSGEWEEKQLGEVSTWMSGGTPSKDNLEYWNGDIPWISASSMRGHYYSSSDLMVTNKAIGHGTRIVPEETLLLLVRGSMLYNTIPVGLTTRPVTFNQDVKAIEFNETITKQFALQWFLHSQHKLLGMVVSTGIGAGKLDTNDLYSMKFNYPTQYEQHKIASFLSAIDAKIDQLTRKKELLEQYKKGVMQKIFSQELRFKADDGSEFPKWEEKKIGDIFEVTRGYVLAVSAMSQEKDEVFQYPVYSSQTKNKGLTGYYNDFLYEDAITWTTDGANAGEVNLRRGKFYCTNVCGVLKSDKGYANQCIAEILNTVTKKYVSYVGNPKLMNNTMAGIKIVIPKSIDEQTKIANFLSAIDTKIDLVAKQLDEAKNFKKGLLQQMFV